MTGNTLHGVTSKIGIKLKQSRCCLEPDWYLSALAITYTNICACAINVPKTQVWKRTWQKQVYNKVKI